MIINSPVIVKTNKSYEIKVKGPDINELLKLFPNLRMRDDKYLYFEEDGFSPETAIDYSLFTFKTNKWTLMREQPMGVPTFNTKDTIIRFNIMPVHPALGENYTEELKGQYFNPTSIDVTFEEASHIFEDPKAFIESFVSEHLFLFSMWIHTYIKSWIQSKANMRNLNHPYYSNKFQQPQQNGMFANPVSPTTSAFDDLMNQLGFPTSKFAFPNSDDKKNTRTRTKKTIKSGAKHGVLFNSKEDVASDVPSVDTILADACAPTTGESPLGGVVVDPAE